MRRRGFTLVELLVVIGIIAVLISILLPSLARARSYANNLSCQSNLRTVGQALMFYANDHKGKLPFGGNGLWADIWPGQVSTYLGSKMSLDASSNTVGNYSKALRCVDAMPEATVDQSWNGGFHYTANCRAMPEMGQSDPMKNWGPCTPYPLACKWSAEKMLMWDGGILPQWGYNAPSSNQQQAYCVYSWGNGWADPAWQSWFNANQPAPISGHWNNNLNPGAADWIGVDNLDGGPGDYPWEQKSFAYQRYRHLGNTSCNFLFFDGHVEARKLGTVMFRELSLYVY